MGKANRIKNEKATSVLAAPAAKRAEKKSMPTWVGTVIVVAVLALLVLAVTFTALSTRGVFTRGVVIAETDNYKVNANMMSYMIHTEYWNMVNTYANLSQQIYPNGGNSLPIPGGKGGTALQQGVPLRDQIYSNQNEDGTPAETVTWFDYFANQAREELSEILAYCEYARATGIELDDNDKEELDKSLEQLSTYALLYGFDDANAYFSYMYGKGVRERDVRRMMELQALANKASHEKEHELFEGITDTAINGEYDANVKTYNVYADWISYTFTVTFTPSTKTGDAAAAENAERKKEYEEKQALYAGYVAQLAECTTAEQFNAKLAEILQDMFYAEELKSAESKLAEGESLTAAQLQACEDAAEKRVEEALKKAVVENGKTSDLTGEAKTWFEGTGDKAVKPGDVKKFEDKNDCEESKPDSDVVEYKKATSTYSAYYAKSALHRNADVVRSVAHILFKSDSFDKVSDISTLSEPWQTLAKRITKRGEKVSAETMAKELIAKMSEDGALTQKTKQDGTVYFEISKDAFEKYGIEYTEDSGVVYENVKKGDMVEEFENWLFDASRVEGEMSSEGIKTTYGYHIMLYVGDEMPAWEFDIREKLTEEAHKSWTEQVKTEYAVTFTDKDSKWNKVDDSTK